MGRGEFRGGRYWGDLKGIKAFRSFHTLNDIINLLHGLGTEPALNLALFRLLHPHPMLGHLPWKAQTKAPSRKEGSTHLFFPTDIADDGAGCRT